MSNNTLKELRGRLQTVLCPSMNQNELTELLKIFEKRITQLETKCSDLERKYNELSARQFSQSESQTSQPSNITKLLNEFASKPAAQKYPFQQLKHIYSKEEMLKIKQSDLYTADLSSYDTGRYTNIELVLDSSSHDKAIITSTNEVTPLSMTSGSMSSFSSPTYRHTKQTPSSLSQRFKAAMVTPESVSPAKNKSSKPVGRIVTLDRGMHSKSDDSLSANVPTTQASALPVKPRFDPSTVVEKVSTPPPPFKTEMRYGLMVQIPVDDAAETATGTCRPTGTATVAASTVSAPASTDSAASANNTKAERDQCFSAIDPVMLEEPAVSRSITPCVAESSPTSHTLQID